MKDKPIDGLNMVPFIDIMLVLLTIVLTTSSFIASGRIPVHLPQASVSAPDNSEAETIEIDADGTVFHAGEPVSLDALAQRLSGMAPETTFLLRADKRVALQAFVDVADLLKQKGFTKVAVQTEARQP